MSGILPRSHQGDTEAQRAIHYRPVPITPNEVAMNRKRSVVLVAGLAFVWILTMTFIPSFVPRTLGDNVAGVTLGAAMWTITAGAVVALVYSVTRRIMAKDAKPSN